MADSKLTLLKETCSFLNNVIDQLKSSQDPSDNCDALLVSKKLVKKLHKMSLAVKRTGGNIVLIPDRLMALFHCIQKELSKGSCSNSYYCDLCGVTAPTAEIWTEHVDRNKHSSVYPETMITCKVCGLGLYGVEENLLAYINSPSHQATDLIRFKYCSEVERPELHFHLPMQVSPEESFSWNTKLGALKWRTIKKYAFISVSDNSLLVFGTIKAAGKAFQFNGNKRHHFQSMCDWMKAHFNLLTKPVIQCDICDITREFSTVSLWKHLVSKQHIQKSTLVSEKKGFLICSKCQKVLIGSVSILIRHSHGGAMTVVNLDSKAEMKELVQSFETLLKKDIFADRLKNELDLGIDKDLHCTASGTTDFNKNNEQSYVMAFDSAKCSSLPTDGEALLQENNSFIFSSKDESCNHLDTVKPVAETSVDPNNHFKLSNCLLPDFARKSLSKIDPCSSTTVLVMPHGVEENKNLTVAENSDFDYKQRNETDITTLLTNAFKYLQNRFSKESFCSCCASVYFCSVCNFICTYRPFWGKHLGHDLHKSKLGYKKQYLVTDICRNCGIQVYIECKLMHLLDLPIHSQVDTYLSSLVSKQNTFYFNCSKDHRSKQTDSLFLNNILHTNACKPNCCYNTNGPGFVLQNFTLNSLEKDFNNFILTTHLNDRLQTAEADRSFKFTCFLCTPLCVGLFSNFHSHINNMHRSELNEACSKSTSRLAAFCYECFNLFVIYNTSNFNSSNLFDQKPCVCEHKSVRTIIALYTDGQNITETLQSDNIKIQLPVDHKEPSLGVLKNISFSKRIESIFIYLVDRYTRDPFCRECPTYYFCTICCYGTSYWPYWQQHFLGEQHNQNPNKFTLHQCLSCGLAVYVNKTLISYLDTEEHRNADRILKNIVHKPGSFMANCKKAFVKTKVCNKTFLSNIGHYACKDSCSFLKALKSLELMTAQPFILVNFSLIELKKKLQSFILRNSSVIKGKREFCCLDCEPVAKGQLDDLEDHLIKKHGVGHKCADSRNCFRISLFCCVCTTLMISTCRKTISKLLSVKGSDHCQHVKLVDNAYSSIEHFESAKKSVYMLNRLDELMMNSRFRCVYLKNNIVYYCSLCNINFKSLENFSSHVSLLIHASIFANMVLFFCYKCNKISLHREIKDPANYKAFRCCFYFSQILRMLVKMKNDCGPSSPLKDTSDQIKCLPDVTLRSAFKGGETEFVSCTVLSSYFEYYNIVVPLPVGSSANFVDSYVIEKYVDLSAATYIKNLNSPDLWCECLICDKTLQGAEQIFSHMQCNKHAYYSYFMTCTNQAVPFMVFCETCSLVLISAEIISLEQHFNSKKHLMKLRKPKIVTSTLEDDELWPISNLSDNCLCMFGSKASMNAAVMKLFAEMESASNFYVRIKDKLNHDICSVLTPFYPKAEVYFFGSRETSLAKRDSDIDVFVDLGGYYMEECKNITKKTKEVAGFFLHRKNRKFFECRQTILNARVPIIKLWHRSFKIDIDLNCLNSAGSENTKLLRFYLDFDVRCKWLAAVIKEWASMNYLIGVRSGFNSYTILWLVFFFLMQPNIGILPNVLFLKSLYEGTPFVINGWDYSFTLNQSLVKRYFNTTLKSSSLTKLYLLKEFFKFYSNLETEHVFICPLMGKTVPSKTLSKSNHIYCNAHNVPVSMDNFDYYLNIMDPIILDFNVSKNIPNILWKHFKILCIKMGATCNWLK